MWISRWGIQYLFMLDGDDIIRTEHLAREFRRRSADAFELVDRCEYQGALEVFMFAHAFGSAAYGLTTGVCKIMAAAALVAWQVGASRTWTIPHSPLGHVDGLADCDGLPHGIRADKLIATACMNSQVRWDLIPAAWLHFSWPHNAKPVRLTFRPGCIRTPTSLPYHPSLGLEIFNLRYIICHISTMLRPSSSSLLKRETQQRS